MTFNDHNPSIDPSIHTPEISHVCWQNPSAVNVDAGFSWMISPTISALCFVVTWWNNVTQRCQKTNQGCGALWEKNWIATASLGKNLVWNTVCSFVIYQYQYIYIIWMPLNACLLFNGGYLAIDPLQWEKGFAAVPHRQWHLSSMCFHLRMMATISYLEWWSLNFTGGTYEVPPDDPADDDKSLS